MEKNINQIIKDRRSIYPKEYTGEIIPDEVIITLLENANFAPNHHSNYPWRFVVIKPHKIKVWLEQAAEIYKTESTETSFKQEKYQKILDHSSKISHSIAIVYNQELDSKAKYIEDICAIACAVQNMYLSLTQFEQVGGYWSTGLGTNSKLMHDYLNLESNQQLLGFLILGNVENKRTLGGRKNYEHFVRDF